MTRVLSPVFPKFQVQVKARRRPAAVALMTLATVCAQMPGAEAEGAKTRPPSISPETSTALTQGASSKTAEAFVLKSSEWEVVIDPQTGGIAHLVNPTDPQQMDWIHSNGAKWGTGILRLNGTTSAWEQSPEIRSLTGQAMEARYRSPQLEVTVRRALSASGRLTESYVWKNVSDKPLSLPHGAIGIRIPLNDNYPGAPLCITKRCNAHVWAGGGSAFINAIRMGGEPPHLGLVLTGGSVDGYSNEMWQWSSNDRGNIILHPAPAELAPGESGQVSWELFWNQGWDDFFEKAGAIPGFVRLDAADYTITLGQPLQMTARSAGSLDQAILRLNGREVTPIRQSNRLSFECVPTQLGEQSVEIEVQGRKTQLRAWVSPEPWALVASRVKFIIEKQQVNQPGAPADGAYVPYDNEKEKQDFSLNDNDHNPGRERLGMGVLLALYLPHCKDAAFRGQITASLDKYWAFIQRELLGPDGTVYGTVGMKKDKRLYNIPWVAHFCVAMYEATGDVKYLQRFVDICRISYAKGMEKFYCIGMPIREGLDTLKTAGLDKENEEVLGYFRRHAERMLANGTDYPKSEVNYEQSIVAPAAQILLDFYMVSKDPRYLDAARKQLKVTEAFGGRQPDHRLHDIAIRHWDDFWFGKMRLYGDTFPHYWSTITGVVFAEYAEATGEAAYARRADGILKGNFSLFTPEGSGSCAHVYADTVIRQNGDTLAGRANDPLANDQDWALVHWLQVENRKAKAKSGTARGGSSVQ